ncbi:glycosyl transferase family 2 [Chromobacterium alticapitis]|uniref:Glycosyl transferase family 2 n=2 Tax=Chromobacterium alticapitis TaxID=2073169 RepID=A0A2S5DHS3_9NEIS|nr:glycosyl transferase family 2 [Chromobacterium alticapitis]
MNTPALMQATMRRNRNKGIEPIVIYPEVVHGNPLSGDVVVRYILNKPGFIGGPTLYDDGDILFVYNKGDFLPPGMEAELMRTPVLDIEIFNNKNNAHDAVRKGKYVYAHRYCQQGGNVDEKILQETERLDMAKPRSLVELAELFRKAECLYSYEMSAICTEAMLCGCPVIYMPSEYLTKIPNLDAFHGDGSAWGNTPEQIEHAKRSVGKVYEHYEKQVLEFPEQLERFISITQRAAAEKTHEKRVEKLRPRRPRIGILTGELLDTASYNVRLGDPLALMSPVLDTYFYKNQAAYSYEGEFPFQIDGEFVEVMDMFVIHHGFPIAEFPDLIDLIVESEKPIVYEAGDGSLMARVEPATHFSEGVSRKNEEWLLQHCSLVVASTDAMAEKMLNYTKKAIAFPDLIARDRLVDPMPRGEKVTIGISGDFFQESDWEIVSSALMRIGELYGDAVRIVLLGDIPPGFVKPKNCLQVSVSKRYGDYLVDMAKLSIDIALAPLGGGDFNAFKSDAKWLEYSVIGAATIASDVLTYRWLKEKGLATLVDDTEAGWVDGVCKLIDNPELRSGQANSARQYVLNNRLLENRLGELLEKYLELLPDHLKQLPLLQPGHVVTRRLAETDIDGLTAYREWLASHELRAVHAEQLAERMVMAWGVVPIFNIIMLASAGRLARLSESFASMEKILYRNWRLIVISDAPEPDPVFSSSVQLGWLQLDSLENDQLVVDAINGIIADVPSDWSLLLPAGARLQPNALARIGEEINAHSEYAAIYFDHDVVSPVGHRFCPAFLPDFSPEYLRSMDYIGYAVAFKTENIAMLGGFQPYPKAHCYDALLRVFERGGAECIGHIDDQLISMPWQESKLDVLGNASRQVALENHIVRMGCPARVSEGFVPGTFFFDFQLLSTPLISIVIPNNGSLKDLAACVDSLFEVTGYQNFEVLIVDKGISKPGALEYFNKIQDAYPGRIKIVNCEATSNLSMQCNIGARNAAGEYLLLLRHDFEIAQDNWLERMLATAQQPGVGAVGPRIQDVETGSVKHAGFVLGMPGDLYSVAGSVFEGMSSSLPGYINRNVTMQNYSAISGACLIVEKKIYDAVSGMDESFYGDSLIDVDFCLKIVAGGLRNIYNPHVELLAHLDHDAGDGAVEAKLSSGHLAHPCKDAEVMLERWAPILRRDPGYNRHLSLRSKNMGIELDQTVAWDVDLPNRVRVLGISAFDEGTEYRLSQPLSILRDNGKLDGEIHRTLNGLPSVVELYRQSPNTLLLNVGIHDDIYEAVAAYRKHLPDLRIVFGLDDLGSGTACLYDYYVGRHPDAKQHLQQVLKLCDATIVSTQPLADLLQDMEVETIVIPSRLSRATWDGLASARHLRAKPRVGLVGTGLYGDDIALLDGVIQATCQEVEWVFLGNCPSELAPYFSEMHPTAHFSEHARKMASLNLDLAVAPLEINLFNVARSNIRLLEHGALACPVVCTDIYPFQTNNAPVCRVSNDAAAWIRAIRERAHDWALMEKEGDALKKWVSEHYWLEDHCDDWLRTLQGKD